MSALAQWTNEAVFSATAASAAEARRFLVTSLAAEALPQRLVDDITVVGSELATQALLHTRTPFAVKLSLFPDHLRLEVRDSSQSDRDPTPLRVFSESHRAMVVVEALSTRWGVSTVVDDGSPVWAMWAHFDRA